MTIRNKATSNYIKLNKAKITQISTQINGK